MIRICSMSISVDLAQTSAAHTASPRNTAAHVRFGSLADILRCGAMTA